MSYPRPGDTVKEGSVGNEAKRTATTRVREQHEVGLVRRAAVQKVGGQHAGPHASKGLISDQDMVGVRGACPQLGRGNKAGVSYGSPIERIIAGPATTGHREDS